MLMPLDSCEFLKVIFLHPEPRLGYIHDYTCSSVFLIENLKVCSITYIPSNS